MTVGEPGSRVWFVTGATSGLGRAIADAALAAGDTVVGAARRPEALAGAAAASGGRLHPVRLDVADTAACAAAVDDVVARFGRIDVLVNSAGYALVGAVEETTERELRDLMDVHFFGPFALVRAALPHLRGAGSGAIVQISSLGGQVSFPGVAAYAASKFALEGLSESLAAEVAPFGVRVLIVEPGAFRTELHGSARESAELPEYAEIVGPGRRQQIELAGRQPGDPAKAAAAILGALAAERPPLRLALGNDAADQILGHLDAVRGELLEWEHVTRSTDLG